jgi:nicotinamidase-related amidase
MIRAALSYREESQLVIVDMQDKLCGAMDQDALQPVVRNCATLLQAARLLNIPALYTEQAPAKLGATLPDLTQWLEPSSRVEKTCFSCCEESDFCAQLDDTRSQVVLAGTETHVCVLQTALQLQEMKHRVFVVEDAVISRSPAHKTNALDRLRQAGVIVTNTESVIFEWLKVAEGDAFRQIAKLVK